MMQFLNIVFFAYRLRDRVLLVVGEGGGTAMRGGGNCVTLRPLALMQAKAAVDCPTQSAKERGGRGEGS